MLDGARSMAEVAEDSPDVLGREVDRETLEVFVARLRSSGLMEDRAQAVSGSRVGKAAPPQDPSRSGPNAGSRVGRLVPQWRVAPAPELLPIAVHPAARFTCEGAGTCCDSGLVVPLSRLEAKRVQSAEAKLFGSQTGSVCMMPTGVDSPWTWALAYDPPEPPPSGPRAACAFLTADRRCMLHGSAAHPSTCRVFPFRFVVAGDRVHASICHRCVCGTLGLGRLLSEQRAEIRARLLSSFGVHAIRDVVRVDQRHVAESEEVVLAAVRASEESDPRRILERLAEELMEHSKIDQARGPAPSLDALCRGLAAELPRHPPDARGSVLLRALEGSRHHLHTTIERDARACGLFDPHADPRAEVGRFVRDFVFGLQFFRFGTIAEGLLALTLAASRVLHDLPEAAHPRARERIILWEGALASRQMPQLMGSGGPIAAVSSSIASVARATCSI
jgi:hypothetical protein